MPDLAATLSQYGMAMWLAAAVALMCLGLVAAMVVQSRRHARMKLALTEGAGPTAGGSHAAAGGLSLDGLALSPIDRVLPRRPLEFLALVSFVSLGTWIAGYALAPNKEHFLTSPEWLFQPFYVAVHLIALRLFINVFTRNYAAGVLQLDVSFKQALRGIRLILGPYGVAAAALIAAPFCYFDFRYLFSARYARMGRDEIVRAADYLMWMIWSLEWFINAFIWVLLIGFMIKNCMTIGRFPFRAPIDVVLHDKLYRPFLQMSSQGSTVVLGFSLVTVLYLYYSGGELTDYLGLGITVALLVVCFVPPWLVLRGKVDEAVRIETYILRRDAGLGAQKFPASTAMSVFASGRINENEKLDPKNLETRVDEALALLRLWHLQNLYGNLGHTEAKAIVVRLLAPAATIGWQVANSFANLSQRLSAMMGAATGQ